MRTGYEAIIPYRVSKLYAYVAREEGVVKEITKNVVVIKYKSGKEERLPLGRRSGKWQGKIVPHELITDLKVGDKFKERTPITYNPLFFQYNWVSGELAYKQGLLARVAFIESSGTYEDSSEMSAKFTAGLETSIVEERSITVYFNQEVEDLVKVGAEVEYETKLCRLLDTLSTTSSERLFTSDSREILADLQTIAPSAEVKGKVVSIEAVYCGDPDEMTESLRTIVEKADREKSNAAKELGKARQDGSVDPGFRIGGIIIEPNSCIIRVAIETSQAMRTGSKVVLGLQMKSVVGRVWDEDMLTESGQVIDMVFGYQSVQNRVLLSPELLGTTNNLMVAGSKSVVNVFRGNKK